MWQHNYLAPPIHYHMLMMAKLMSQETLSPTNTTRKPILPCKFRNFLEICTSGSNPRHELFCMGASFLLPPLLYSCHSQFELFSSTSSSTNSMLICRIEYCVIGVLLRHWLLLNKPFLSQQFFKLPPSLQQNACSVCFHNAIVLRH